MDEQAQDCYQQNDDAFFELAGMWQERDVTLETIRQKAWSRQYGEGAEMQESENDDDQD